MPDGTSIILNASSNRRQQGIRANSVYSATKAARPLVRADVTTDLKDRRIRVNAVSPGPIDTPDSTSCSPPRDRPAVGAKMIAATVAVGRLGSSDEIAKAVAFLASDDSATSRESSCSWMGASPMCRRGRKTMPVAKILSSRPLRLKLASTGSRTRVQHGLISAWGYRPGHQRKRFLHGEEQPFHVDVEDGVVELFGDRAEGSVPRDARHSQRGRGAVPFLAGSGEEAIEIAGIRNVAPDRQ